MKNIKITIPQPCTEDWLAMTSVEQGKHCASCNKVVIDFSGMKDDEILKIIGKNKGEKICGNFYNTQIDRPIKHLVQPKQNRWPAIAAMLVAGIFQLLPTHSYAQERSPQRLYPPSMAFAKQEPLKDEIKTVPSKDSLWVYTITIQSRDSKNAIAGAKVSILDIGSYTTDGKGNIQFSIEENKIPELLKIEVSAYGYVTEKITIAKSRIGKTRHIELFLNTKEVYMLKGDVSIEDSH